MKKTATAAAAPIVVLEDHKNEPVPIDEPSLSRRDFIRTTELQREVLPLSRREFLTTSELQREVLPLSRRSIFDLRQKGVLPSITCGGKVLFHKASVIEAMLRRQSNGHNGHA